MQNFHEWVIVVYGVMAPVVFVLGIILGYRIRVFNEQNKDNLNG